MYVCGCVGGGLGYSVCLCGGEGLMMGVPDCCKEVRTESSRWLVITCKNPTSSDNG